MLLRAAILDPQKFPLRLCVPLPSPAGVLPPLIGAGALQGRVLHGDPGSGGGGVPWCLIDSLIITPFASFLFFSEAAES